MKFIVFILLLTTCCCDAQTMYKKTGTIERFDSTVNAIISPNAKAEVIAEGFEWSEGPLWLNAYGMLLFSDVPRNTIYKWTAGKGTQVYLKPSGYTGPAKRGGETGSNGLTLDNKGALVLCQHGDRRMAKMIAPLKKPAAKFTTIAGTFEGKKFNSPNDAVYSKNGDLFFTDPPYGLEKGMEDPAKEISFQGVYKRSRSGKVSLVTDSITRPNGIAIFPGGKTLIVANSDGNKPNWYLFDIAANGAVSNGRIFYSAADADRSWKGGPDGLKIDKNGNVFATGPGGIWIFNSNGKLLGRLRLEDAASNCALSADEKVLYITNHMKVVRFTMR